MAEEAIKVGRALLSVSDKRGVADFARGLAELDVELISTGGTAAALREAGLAVRDVSEVTGSPEMLNGRVKTLHPSVHGAVLARRDRPDDMARLRELGIEPIDLVIVNLYPFAETIADKETPLTDALEQIDIGGPTLLRAAAKNFRGVAVICDPEDYPEALRRLRESGGTLDLDFRSELAARAFSHTAQYDATIYSYLSDQLIEGESAGFPASLTLRLEKVGDLRYGENPHQRAALYREIEAAGDSLPAAEQLSGIELSFNNLLDFEGAWQLASEFEGKPFCAIIKHSNPCGAALGDTTAEAFETALQCDPVSAFGGVVALNAEVDLKVAERIAGIFVEGVIAPAFSDEALARLKRKKRLRLLRCPPRRQPGRWDIRRISGGLLLQDYDWDFDDPGEWQVVTERKATEDELRALRFAWRICKHVKSNAIVFAAADRILGVGAGQMSRVDSARIAAARFEASKVCGPIAMASDAFFPFRDGLDVGAEAGASAVVQPGGSKRDSEVIAAADEHGIAMLFTGRRHFRH